jgi:hypothetical protein
MTHLRHSGCYRFAVCTRSTEMSEKHLPCSRDSENWTLCRREWLLGLDASESEHLRPLLRLARNEFCKSLRGISEDDNT